MVYHDLNSKCEYIYKSLKLVIIKKSVGKSTAGLARKAENAQLNRCTRLKYATLTKL